MDPLTSLALIAALAAPMMAAPMMAAPMMTAPMMAAPMMAAPRISPREGAVVAEAAGPVVAPLPSWLPPNQI